MSMVGFPLLLIPLAIYNIIVFLMPGVSLSEPVARIGLVSGAEWPLNLSDMLLALGIVMLLFEVIKGARPGAKFLTDHLLSLVIFAAAAAEFLLWPRFGNSTYFLLALLTLVDFLTGVTLRVRRGAKAIVSPNEVHEPAPRSPPLTRAPMREAEPPAPAADGHGSTRPSDHSAPAPVHPEAAPPVSPPPSPEISSPELQPTDGAQRPPGAVPRPDPDLK
jgi:hypothetical protein